mmetsp:Transcript_1054/g.2961  ORF Transcript_1054/g.2961 Transcript_1054/m.2961 type:complete len:235 (+) Transcript_1054:1645-2349(+)
MLHIVGTEGIAVHRIEPAPGTGTATAEDGAVLGGLLHEEVQPGLLPSQQRVEGVAAGADQHVGPVHHQAAHLLRGGDGVRLADVEAPHLAAAAGGKLLGMAEVVLVGIERGRADVNDVGRIGAGQLDDLGEDGGEVQGPALSAGHDLGDGLAGRTVVIGVFEISIVVVVIAGVARYGSGGGGDGGRCGRRRYLADVEIRADVPLEDRVEEGPVFGHGGYEIGVTLLLGLLWGRR